MRASKKVTIGPGRDTALLWLRRSIARYTDGGPRLSGAQVVGLVDGDGWRVTEGLPIDERHRRLQDIMCKCGFAKCAERGLCAPPTVVDAGALNSHQQETEGAIIDARYMTASLYSRMRYECSRCAWQGARSFSDVIAAKAPAFRIWEAHDCADWPDGTHAIGMRCVVHGDSKMFPTQALADAWFAGHVDCSADLCRVCQRAECTPMCEGSAATDAEVRADAAAFKIGDRVKWSLWGRERAGVIDSSQGFGWFVKSPDHGGLSFVHGTYLEHDVAPPAAKLFDVGDHVLVARNTSGGWFPGTCGMVAEKNSDGVRVQQAGDTFEGFWHKRSDLEHVR